jgi:LytR_cpsA_psr family
MHKRAVGAVVLLGVVIAATVGILVARQQPVTPPPDEPPAPATRTLLVQLRDPSLLAMGSVMMGVDEARLDQLWWTADWWIDQAGVQEVSAAELGRKPVSYVMQTVQNQVGVTVDDAWVLDRLAFAGLVDAVGGVRIDLRRPTVYLTDQGTPALLPAGVQTLAGAQAADYVLDASLRDETLRLVRFQSVWDQVLRRFPTDPEKARTLVVSLGALSKATMPTEELSVLLADAHDLRITGAYAQAQVGLDEGNAVRVRPVEGVRIAYAVDPARTAQDLGSVFDGFPAPEEPVARIQAVTIRSADIEALRAQLLGRSWQSAWGGRTITAATAVVVDPSVPDEQVVGLEQAVGVTPLTEDLPLGQARVSVAADEDLAVGS